MTKPVFIEEARKALGLTQKEFADKIGYSVDSVQSWETGRRNPSSAVIFMIDAILTDAK
jgi:DNA-binding transcriptional regulator YiaG